MGFVREMRTLNGVIGSLAELLESSGRELECLAGIFAWLGN
jgi:hypothetical protein